VPGWAREQLLDLCRRYLEPLRDRYGPTRVMSGYRTRAYNARVGGAPGSFHIYGPGRQGVAADVVPARGTPAQWAELLERLGAPGLGVYHGHVHVDTRPSRARWSSTAE
jgi:uncharacterized protein YcbK (DUF882 family)